jgi:hypothetical protein
MCDAQRLSILEFLATSEVGLNGLKDQPLAGGEDEGAVHGER